MSVELTSAVLSTHPRPTPPARHGRSLPQPGGGARGQVQRLGRHDELRLAVYLDHVHTVVCISGTLTFAKVARCALAQADRAL